MYLALVSLFVVVEMLQAPKGQQRALPNWTYVCNWGGAGWGYNYVRTIIKSCISIKACNHVMQIIMTIPSLIHSGLELLLETHYKKIAFAISFGQF